MAKGQQGERDVAKDLSLWWTHYEREDIFWRTSGSGARATVRQKTNLKTTNSAGDFCYIDPIGKPLIDLLLIENKVGYTKLIDPLASIDGKKADILEVWYDKARSECASAGRFAPIIIFKRNRKQRCILIPSNLWYEILRLAPIKDKTPRICIWPKRTFIMGFDNFLSWCTPEAIKKIAKEKLE